jgi:hypothetical protein
MHVSENSSLKRIFRRRLSEKCFESFPYFSIVGEVKRRRLLMLSKQLRSENGRHTIRTGRRTRKQPLGISERKHGNIIKVT